MRYLRENYSDTMIVLWTILTFGCQVLAQEYLGCFQSPASDPDLPSLILTRASSPTECIKECVSRYYKFAGLMNGQQCYCGSKYGKNGLSNACTIPCATDSLAFCGSHDAISVYTTGQKGPSPPRRVEIIRSEPNALRITWEPPDIPNGNITSYVLRATAVETYALDPLPPVESQVQGGASNSTTLRGLQPGTKYNVSVVAINLDGNSNPAYASDWMLIGPPNKPAMPKIISRNDTTVTIMLSKGSSEYGPVSAYRVIVVRFGTIPPVSSDAIYFNYDKSNQDGLGYYITGEFDASDFQKYEKFIVGDGKLIGGYYNAPLSAEFVNSQIGLIVVSRVRGEVQYGYSNLTNGIYELQRFETTQMDSTTIGLCIAIVLLGALLVASILAYFMLRRYHRKGHMRRLPEQQELTLQGPVYEIDNVAYIPEDVPERTNHYQELKNKVWSIPRNILTIDSVVIRRGRFGTVHAGSVQKDGIPSNATIHSISDGLLRASEKRLMLRELDVCIRVGTMKYLAGLIGTCETPDTLYVVLEMPPQTLKNRLLSARSGDTFPTNRILSIGTSIASALQYLENHKVVHNFLCARSVGLCHDWTPKVMGHGIAKYVLEDMKYIRWTAVECLDNEKKHQRSVVWAFGVLLWEMFSMGGTPYANFTSDSDVENAVKRGERLLQLRDIPDPLYEVMLSCWQLDPQERPTFEELVRLDTLSTCPITAITEQYLPELELN